MNCFIPFLMLFMPGVIAVSIHNGQLVHVTRENWQRLLWQFLLYSFAIVFTVYCVLFITYPQRTVSFSLSYVSTDSNIYGASFVVKYMVFSLIAAWALPKLCINRNNWRKNRKNNKLGDDE